VNARDQVTGIETRNGANAVTGTEVLVYDANGNRIGRSVGGVTQTHRYDRRNRELARGGVRYEHNDADVRTAQVDGGLRTEWVMDGLSLQAEVRGGTTVAQYRYGRELIGEVRGAVGRTILSDGHRSPVVVLESTGNVTDRVRYSAGGEVQARTGSSPLAFGYGGYLTQAGTEELYAFARTYRPGLARFNEVDPLRSFDAQLGMGSHRYVLGYGNPIRYVDPDGRIAFLSDAENYLRDTIRSYDGSIDRALSEGSTSRAFGYGFGKGLVSAGSFVVGGLNTASNLLAQNMYDGETYAQARRELDANEAAAVEVIEGSVALGGALKNDFGGTVVRGGQAVGRFAGDVAQGDPRAWASVGEMAGEGLGGAPAGALSGRAATALAARAARRAPMSPRVVTGERFNDLDAEAGVGQIEHPVQSVVVERPGGDVATEADALYAMAARNATYRDRLLHQRINLRGAVADEFARLSKGKTKSQIRREVGPVLAGVMDTKTNAVYFALNKGVGELPDNLVPMLYDRMPGANEIYHEKTHGAGTHAEIHALNDAFLARMDAKMEDFLLYTINSGQRSSSTRWGLPVPRCPHCEVITDGVQYFPESMRYRR
jgi:RHS repeat-associated protein